MMKKSWADHCSSDEESIDDDVGGMEDLNESAGQMQLVDPMTGPGMDADGKEPHADFDEQHEEMPPVEVLYDIPDKPPFTLFVGNLNFDIKEPDQLKHAVADAVADRFGQTINVVGGRIGIDRRDGRHRGFGYVEVETVDELKLVLQLNDGKTTIAGRKIQIDTANQGANNSNNNRRGSNRSSFNKGGDGNVEQIDGSKFRGGRYNSNNGNRRGSASRRSGTDGSSAPQEDRPVQRTSLKLAPRTRPVDEGGENKQGSSSDIFGGAKARDESAWEKKRMEQKQQRPQQEPNAEDKDKKTDGSAPAATQNEADRTANKDGAQPQERRRSSTSSRGGGKGGRGRGGVGGGGRGKGGGGEAHNQKRNSNASRNSKPQISPEEKAAVSSTSTYAPKSKSNLQADPSKPQAPPKPKVSNKFAALMDDSDSD